MSDECYSPNGKGCSADRQPDNCCEWLRPGARVRMRVYAPRLRARGCVGHNRAVLTLYPMPDATEALTSCRARCLVGHADGDGAVDAQWRAAHT